MKFDLTSLSAGQIAALAAIASIIVAVVSAIGAFATALVNGYSARRLEYIKIVQQAKVKQARLLRRILNADLNFYLKLVASRRNLPRPELASDGPVMLPLFLAGDRRARKLSRVLGEQSRAAKKILEKSPETLSDETIADLRRLIQVLGVFIQYLELSVLRPATDPTRYFWRVKFEAWLITRGRYPKFHFRQPGKKY